MSRKRKQSGSVVFNIIVFFVVFSLVTTLFIKAAVIFAVVEGIAVAIKSHLDEFKSQDIIDLQPGKRAKGYPYRTMSW